MFSFPTEQEETEKEQRFLEDRDADMSAKRSYLPNLESQIQKDKSFLESIGETSWDAVKSTGSGIADLLDVLGTPGQFMSGVGAKLFGDNDYKNLDWLSAGSKGATDNRSGAANLRNVAFFKDHPILRGAAGFALDVATDPLSWISLFPQGASIAGRALSDIPLETIAGKFETAAEISRRIEDAHRTKLFSLLDDLPSGDMKGLLTAEAGIRAKAEARRVMESALSFGNKAKKLERSGASKLVPEAIEAAKLKDLAELGIGSSNPELLSLKNAEDLSKLYKRKTIRFTSPFAGVPGIGEHLPILGTREADIPIISDAITKIHDGLENAYYGTKLKVRNWIPEAMAEDSPYLNRFAASFVKSAANSVDGAHAWTVGKLGHLSKRIASTGQIFGDRQVSNQVDSFVRDREFLLKVEAAKVGLAGDKIAQFADGDDILKQITWAQDAVVAKGLQQKEKVIAEIKAQILGGQNLKGPALRKAEKDALRQAKKQLAGVKFPPDEESRSLLIQELQKRVPNQEKFTEALKLSDHIQQRYAALAQKDIDAGLLDTALDNYFIHAFDPTEFRGDYENLSRGAIAKMASAVRNGTVDFTKMRNYSTLQQAIGNGLKAEDNALKLLIAREYASKLAHAQKEFAERMAWQHGVRSEVYQGLVELTKSESNAMRYSALNALSDLDIMNRKDLTIPALQFNNGRPMTPEKWDDLANVFKFSSPENPALRDAIENTTNMRTMRGAEVPAAEFFSDPKYRNLVESTSKIYENSASMVPGYIGESAFAGAGGTTVRPFIKAKMLKNLSPEDSQFWDNVIPTHMANALEDAYSTGEWLKRYVEKNKQGKAKNDLVRAVDGSLTFLGNVNKVLKAGMLTIWPSRYTRDLTSAGVQAGLVMSPFEQVGAIGRNLAQLPIQATHGLVGAIGDAIGRPNMAERLGEFLNIPSVIHANDIFTGADMLTNSGRAISNKELHLAALKAGFEWNGNYSTDLVSSFNDMLSELTQSSSTKAAIPGLSNIAKDTKELSSVQKGITWGGKKWGLTLDDRFWQRFPDFAERLERYGRTHTFLELVKRDFDFDEAAALANRMHVDYKNAKTPFERKFLNNLFFFYSFSRGNASTLAQALMKKPGALTTQMHLRQSIAEVLKNPEIYTEDPDAERFARSKRLDESMALYIGTNKKTGVPTFLSGTGLPIEDITKYAAISLPGTLSVRDVLRAGSQTAVRSTALIGSQTNPLIKTAIETMTGRSLFYDRPLTDATLRKIPKWERDSSILNKLPFRAVPKEVWQALDVVTKEVLDAKDNGDGTFTVNPYALSVMTVILPGLSSLAPANPVIGSLSPLKYGSRFLSTRKGLTEPGKSDIAKGLNLLTGLKIDEVDPDSSALYDEARDLNNYMDYLGIPKSKKRRAQMMQAETEEE